MYDNDSFKYMHIDLNFNLAAARGEKEDKKPQKYKTKRKMRSICKWNLLVAVVFIFKSNCDEIIRKC